MIEYERSSYERFDEICFHTDNGKIKRVLFHTAIFGAGPYRTVTVMNPIDIKWYYSDTYVWKECTKQRKNYLELQYKRQNKLERILNG